MKTPSKSPRNDDLKLDLRASHSIGHRTEGPQEHQALKVHEGDGSEAEDPLFRVHFASETIVKHVKPLRRTMNLHNLAEHIGFRMPLDELGRV